MCDIYKRCPRSKPKAAFDKWEIELDIVNAAEVLPFRRKRWERVPWESKTQETLESIISGIRNEDCGGRVQNAHIPSEAAAEA
jgi:hypothetical protein